MRIVLWLALALLALPAQAQAPARFSFAIVGDAPYNALEEIEFAHELKEIDRFDLCPGCV